MATLGSNTFNADNKAGEAMNNDLQTISWDNTNIYKNFSDPQILIDIQNVEEKICYLKSKLSVFEKLVPLIETTSFEELEETIPLARETYRLILDTRILLSTVGVYSSTALSVDSLNYDAKNLASRASQLSANLNKTAKPLNLFLLRAPKSYLDLFLKDERVNEMAFLLNYEKKEEDFLLSVSEEILLEGHSVDGLHAWGKLYTELSGSMKAEIDGEPMGLAQASNIIFQDDPKKRETAYHAVNKAWQQHEISAAAILNSINGWRLENNRARSGKKELHYLDKSCHQQKITRATLDTLIQTTFDQRHIGHEALKLMAHEMTVQKLGPWDLNSSFPAKINSQKISFPEAMELIIYAFAKFNPDMGEFAKHMVTKRWIDSTPSENRNSGGYCTSFAKVREPRIFLTYDGSMKNIMTLAHELGHAYHNWVMKDLKYGQTFYPSTLAETASIFAETLVRDTILENSKTNEEKKAILWQEVQEAATMLINIPARFDFECRLSELRKTKSATVPELKDLNKKSWQHWYGDTLTEYNEMFWASKLHFSISHMGFYNYPYLFGYLFSLGIYAKKDEFGTAFKNLYINILRDTGAMMAEELIQKHFNEDISKKDFWLKSLRIVEKSVNDFKNLQS